MEDIVIFPVINSVFALLMMIAVIGFIIFVLKLLVNVDKALKIYIAKNADYRNNK